MRKLKFEIYQGKNKQWYFRIKSSNGKIIAQSEGYAKKSNLIKTVNVIKDKVFSANVTFLND
jgi:uncharacterized protein YegP (UPF0339 family)